MQPSKRRETTDFEIRDSVQICLYGEICVLYVLQLAKSPIRGTNFA